MNLEVICVVNSEIIAIKDRLVDTVAPLQLYLFGSYAKDTYGEDSDYDFYLVVPDDAGNRVDISQKAYKSLRGIRKRPVDIVVGYESSFNRRKEEATLERAVATEGVRLYG